MIQRNVYRIDSTRYGIMRMCEIDSIAIHSIDDDYDAFRISVFGGNIHPCDILLMSQSLDSSALLPSQSFQPLVAARTLLAALAHQSIESSVCSSSLLQVPRR